MSLWDIYQSRLDSIGATKREAKLRRESRYLSAKVPDNLSYSTVDIDGLTQEVRDKSNFKFSMSKLTFLHQEAVLILIEQIYRAYKILNNEPYHK